MVEVAFDTASEIAGVALTEGGLLQAELTWRTRQNHSRELLPALVAMLGRSGLSRSDIAALIVCTGPGSYAGLRVGLSTAKTLAYALGVPIVGIGRLAADALPFAVEPGKRAVAVHAAGRAELAWAAYTRAGEELQELAAPRLDPPEGLLAQLKQGDIVCGELPQALIEGIEAAGAAWVAPHPSRVVAVASLGWRRLQAEDIDSADSLVPLYLREPAIGPPKPHPLPPLR